MKKIQLLRLIPIPAVFILLVSFGFWGLRSSMDPDFGWHLKTGRLILERGVPYKDWYSYTMPDFPWIDHEWLADVLLYKVHSIFGNDFLLLILLSIYAFSFFVLRDKNQSLWGFIFTLIFGFFATVGFLGIRPQILSIFFIAVLWRTINNFLNTPSRSAFLLPLMFVLWVNLHGGFFAGLVILSMVLILEIFKKIKFIHKIKILDTVRIEEHSWQKISVLFFILLFSFLATIVNPYGLRIYEEVFRTIGDNFLRFHIAEWLPLFSLGFNMFISLYIAIYAAFLIMFYKKIEFNQIIVSLFFLLLAFSSARHFLIFVIVSTPVISQIFNEIILLIRNNLAKTLNTLNFFQKREIIFLTIMILMFFVYSFYNNFLTDFLNNDEAIIYPEKAISFLKTLPLSDNIFNDYGWGGYLIWKLPERKYFIDGRMPSWRENGQFAFGDYIKIYEAGEGFEKIMEKYDVKLAILNKNLKDESLKNKDGIFNNFLKKHNWLVYIFGGSFGKDKNLYKELTELGWKTIYEDKTAIILKNN